jgi:hypothetical protein
LRAVHTAIRRAEKCHIAIPIEQPENPTCVAYFNAQGGVVDIRTDGPVHEAGYRLLAGTVAQDRHGGREITSRGASLSRIILLVFRTSPFEDNFYLATLLWQWQDRHMV